MLGVGLMLFACVNMVREAFEALAEHAWRSASSATSKSAAWPHARTGARHGVRAIPLYSGGAGADAHPYHGRDASAGGQVRIAWGSVGDRLGRGEDEAAGLDPLGADQAVGQLADRPWRGRGAGSLPGSGGRRGGRGSSSRPVQVQMLQLGQPLGDPAGVVVVDQGDDPHRVALVVGDGVLDQGRAHQAADRLAPVRVPVLLAVLVELLEQLAADRDAEPDQRVFHMRFSVPVGCSRSDLSSPPDCSTDLGHLDPGSVLVRAGDGRLDERHAGDAVDDARVLERRGDLLAATAADRPFEGPVEVAERLVEPFGVARREPQVGLDRAGEVAVLGPLAVELQGLAAGVVLEDGVVGDRPFERAGGAADAEAVVVLGADGDLRGGDGGDPAVIELGQDGEVVVERTAGDERLEPAAEPGGLAAGDEPDELVGVGADVAAAARGPRLARDRPATTPASAPRTRAWSPASPGVPGLDLADLADRAVA